MKCPITQEDNKILMASNPDYQKNLGGTAQEVSINALGSWKLIKALMCLTIPGLVSDVL